MSTKLNFEDHNSVLLMTKRAQEAESDQRDHARDAKLFLTKRNGQWDPRSFQKMDGRFRGTFDMCTPIVDQISGEIDQSDFTLRVSPSGGGSSKETAKTMDGIIRNIRNISNAETTFNQSGRSNVICGFDCWEVVQDWVDGNSFDQDLFIRRVPNALDSVWFDPASVKQDRSDSNWAVKMTAMPVDDYRKKWPKGKGQSVGDDKRNEAFFNKIDLVRVGQIQYKKPINIEIVRMTDGAVYEVDDDFIKIQDDLANPTPNPDGSVSAPITIELDSKGKEKRRMRKSWRVWSRMFDGGGWLQKAEETVFDFIPLIPVYGNFDIVDDKVIYFGKIENLLDQQRVLNYAMSRDIEDGALSPAPTIWMTEKQAAGNDYSKMNTDRAPVRIYNVDAEAPPISAQSFTGGPQASQGLQTTISNMQQMIAASSNSFQAGQGNAAPSQSGIAGLQQIEQGNIGSVKWFKSLEIAICHTGKVIIGAIPKVYDATRQVRLLEADGTSSTVVLNQPAMDQQTQEVITLNDLSIGDYDVVCEVGPTFISQQKETARTFIEVAKVDPTILETGKDIYLKSLSAFPGMEQMAERARVELFNSGRIPPTQYTDEENEQAQAAQAAAQNQPPQEDPNMIFARAEEAKGQADLQNAQNKQAQVQGDQQIKMQELQLRDKQLDLDVQKFLKGQDDKFNVDAANISLNLEKQDLAERKQEFDEIIAIAQQQQQEVNDAINNLKTIQEASGQVTIMGPGLVDNLKTQSDIVSDAQEDLN